MNNSTREPITTGSDGKGEMGHLATSTPLFTITADGYIPQQAVVELTGIRTLTRVRLLKFAQPVQESSMLNVPGAMMAEAGSATS